MMWKILAVVLVAYSFVAGNLVPLRPGIVSGKTELTVECGKKNSLWVNTYNTRYGQEQPQNVRARIRTGAEQAVCAQAIALHHDRQLHLTFDMPDIDPASVQPPFPLLEIGSPANGYLFTAIPLRRAAGDSSQTSSQASFCTVEAYPEKSGMSFPFLHILEETARNLFFHVPMWFGMMLLLIVSVVFSLRALRQPQNPDHDAAAHAFAVVGTLYGVLGITTGAMWAAYTWNAAWSWDVKQNTAAVALLLYLAYFVLRGSIPDQDKKARIAAIYNIFAFAALFPLLYIIPRMADSMHPGAQGNPGFNSYDLDSNMRLVFYPAVLGWILLGVWASTLLWRLRRLERKAGERAIEPSL